MKVPAGKNILYLSYDGLTDPLGQSQILPYLAGLSEAGYTITIISFEKPDRFSLYRDKIHAYCSANLSYIIRVLLYSQHFMIYLYYEIVPANCTGSGTSRLYTAEAI